MICSICCGCVGGCTDCVSVKLVWTFCCHYNDLHETNTKKNFERAFRKFAQDDSLKNESLAARRQNTKNAVDSLTIHLQS